MDIASLRKNVKGNQIEEEEQLDLENKRGWKKLGFQTL